MWKNYNLDFYMHLKLTCIHEHFDLITNPFKYKCEMCQVFIHPFHEIMQNAKCKMQLMSNGFDTFKMNDSTLV
jgi:hypothetical protein